MMDVYTQHDLAKQHEAEGGDAVTTDWKGADIFPGEQYLQLYNGDLVFEDVDKMQEYIKYRIGRFNTVDKWIANDLGQDRVEFIIALLGDQLQLPGFSDASEHYIDYLIEKFGSLDAWIREDLWEEDPAQYIIEQLTPDGVSLDDIFDTAYQSCEEVA